MAHGWSYTKSSIKHQPQQTKGLHALIIPGQHSCPLELKKNLAVLSLTIVHEKVSLNYSLRVVWAHYMQQISFTYNFFQICVFSLDFNFWPSHQNHSHMIGLIFIGWTKLPRMLAIIIITDIGRSPRQPDCELSFPCCDSGGQVRN